MISMRKLTMARPALPSATMAEARSTHSGDTVLRPGGS